MTIRTSIKKNKYKLIFLVVLFSISIIFGILLFNTQADIVKSAINIEMDMFKELIINKNQNQIIYHLIILTILFALNFTIIGVVGSIFYLFYEGCSLGFSIAVFAYKFNLTGIIFSILFNIITKVVFILLLVYVCLLGIKISKKILGSVVLKKNEITHYFIKRHLILFGIILGSSLLSNIILYFLGNKVLALLLFLL